MRWAGNDLHELVDERSRVYTLLFSIVTLILRGAWLYSLTSHRFKNIGSSIWGSVADTLVLESCENYPVAWVLSQAGVTLEAEPGE